MSGPLELQVWQLALGALLIVLNAGISLYARVGLHGRLLVAAARTVVQLSLLGLVLKWVFSIEGPWAVLSMMLVMAFIAGFEAVRRTTYRVPGLYRVSIGVMMISSMLIAFYGLRVVIRVDPWYTPQYAIPILGMILGNTLNGIALGLETVLAGFAQRRRQVEMLLAHGATAKEASKEIVQDAVRTGLIPILNSMAAVGLISIPGMMTGQILAGQAPGSAVRYQMFIMFSIAGGVALGTFSIVLWARRLVFDDRQRLRHDRIRRKV
ncbi:MAG: iron export ABC transporter permease subunit FetB [Acidobacteriota bacterium]|nr:iron export ABC transporter permease subunit FetB [Acidobacteriota bacterium]MDH3785778.1 iron export ABC transporter permease subunit FetB [Acidobacteriota bacterium]